MYACELLVQAKSLPCRPGKSEDAYGIRKVTFLSHPYPILLSQPHSYSPERFLTLPRLLPSLNIKTGLTSSKKKTLARQITLPLRHERGRRILCVTK